MAESRHDDQQDEQSENQASKDIEALPTNPICITSAWAV